MKTCISLVVFLLSPALAWAGGDTAGAADLTGTVYGYLGIIIFVLAYALVPLENTIHLRKSKPVLLAAGMMLGLGFLGPLSYHIKVHEGRSERYDSIPGARGSESISPISTIASSSLGLDEVIEKSELPAFAIDTNHVVTHWNRATELFTGIRAADIVGTQNHWKPFYETKQPVMADLVLNYMPDRMIDQHYEGHYKRNEFIEGAYEASRFIPTLGEEGRWVSFSATPVRDEDDNIVGAVQILEDYTEKQAAAQRFDLMKKIARAEWDTLLFFYGVILCVGGLA